tara:strand:- start:1775 stop:1945 length:171 start_codon:yes stop_codon:yes gene_type:complete
MREIILNVLEEWKDLQPNMASESYRELLTRELCNAIKPHVNNMIEEIITGAENNAR